MYRILNLIAFIACIVWLTLEPSLEPVVVLIASFAAFFRDDIHGIVGTNFLSLTPKASLIRDLKGIKYSFISSEYINPSILKDLSGWISDTGDQVVSVNVTGSNSSNRYFGQVSAHGIKNEYPIVTFKSDEPTYSYQYIGCSFSGVHIVRTWSNSGGSGVFCSVLLVTLSNDTSLGFDDGKSVKADRLVIKKIGLLPLGDRYEGDLSYKFGTLTILACNGRKSLRTKKSRLLVL